MLPIMYWILRMQWSIETVPTLKQVIFKDGKIWMLCRPLVYSNSAPASSYTLSWMMVVKEEECVVGCVQSLLPTWVLKSDGIQNMFLLCTTVYKLVVERPRAKIWGLEFLLRFWPLETLGPSGGATGLLGPGELLGIHTWVMLLQAEQHISLLLTKTAWLHCFLVAKAWASS